MCCCRMSTVALMANLFAKLPEGRPASTAYFQDYLDYLTQVFPVYLTSDFCESAVLDCVEQFQELYHAQREPCLIVHCYRRPNLEYFNDCFHSDIAAFIERTTERFVSL